MRSGRLLAEESPRVLLSMYNCSSLEEVFLKLSRKQGSDGQPQEGPINISNNISLVSKDLRCRMKFDFVLIQYYVYAIIYTNNKQF